MTRKRKQLYAIVLTLGGIAWVIDRVVLTTSLSTPAMAVASQTANPPTLQPSSSILDDESISIPELPFPKNLPPYDSRFTMRDIFAPPSVLSKINTLQDDADNDRSDIDRHAIPNRSDIFLSQHRLDAVLNGPRLKIAVVDGRWIRIGDTLDGCRFRKIEGTAAIFSCNDGNAILNLVITDVAFPD